MWRVPSLLSLARRIPRVCIGCSGRPSHRAHPYGAAPSSAVGHVISEGDMRKRIRIIEIATSAVLFGTAACGAVGETVPEGATRARPRSALLRLQHVLRLVFCVWENMQGRSLYQYQLLRDRAHLSLQRRLRARALIDKLSSLRPNGPGSRDAHPTDLPPRMNPEGRAAPATRPSFSLAHEPLPWPLPWPLRKLPVIPTFPGAPRGASSKR